MQNSQISATISRPTRERLDTYVRSHGVKKGFLIEQAVLHHLQMLEEIPLDVITPAMQALFDKDPVE